MRTSSYDLFNTIIIQGLNILVSHHLKHKFIACSAHRIAITHFFFAKDRIVDLYFIKYAYKCPGDLLCPLIKTTGTSYPEQNFGALALTEQISCCSNSHQYCSVCMTIIRNINKAELYHYQVAKAITISTASNPTQPRLIQPSNLPVFAFLSVGFSFLAADPNAMATIAAINEPINITGANKPSINKVNPAIPKINDVLPFFFFLASSCRS